MKRQRECLLRKRIRTCPQAMERQKQAVRGTVMEQQQRQQHQRLPEHLTEKGNFLARARKAMERARTSLTRRKAKPR